MSTSQLNTSRTSRNFQKMESTFNMSMAKLNPNVTMETVQSEVRLFMAKREISKIAWLSFVFLTIANVLTLVTAISPGWGWTREINGEFTSAGEYYGLYGVWYICWEPLDGGGTRLGVGNDNRVCQLIGSISKVSETAGIGYTKGVQALSCLTVIAGFICFVTLGAYMCVPMLNMSYKVLGGYIAISSMAVFLNFALFALWGTSFLVRGYWCCDPSEIQRELVEYKLSYCFALSIFGMVAFMTSAIIAGCEITVMKRQRRLERKLRKKSGLRHYDPLDKVPIIDPQAFVNYNNPIMINPNFK